MILIIIPFFSVYCDKIVQLIEACGITYIYIVLLYNTYGIYLKFFGSFVGSKDELLGWRYTIYISTELCS